MVLFICSREYAIWRTKPNKNASIWGTPTSKNANPAKTDPAVNVIHSSLHSSPNLLNVKHFDKVVDQEPEYICHCNTKMIEKGGEINAFLNAFLCLTLLVSAARLQTTALAQNSRINRRRLNNTALQCRREHKIILNNLYS